MKLQLMKQENFNLKSVIFPKLYKKLNKMLY